MTDDLRRAVMDADRRAVEMDAYAEAARRESDAPWVAFPLEQARAARGAADKARARLEWAAVEARWEFDPAPEPASPPPVLSWLLWGLASWGLGALIWLALRAVGVL